MKLARWIFLTAGLYGLAVLTPGLFLPARGQPEFYYGFIGLALVWQLVFLAIARDPVGLRKIIPLCMLEKLSFFAVTLSLFLMGRLEADLFIGGIIDGVWMALFFLAWRLSRADAYTTITNAA